MAGPALQRIGLAGLARATQISFPWKNWKLGAKQNSLDPDDPSKEVLDTLIETEIIPRLMLTNRDAANTSSPDRLETSDATHFSHNDIERFANLVIVNEPEDLIGDIEQLKARGASDETILLNFLAPVARCLGEMWEEDTRDFGEVTIGLMKLHRILESMGADRPHSMGESSDAPKILLAPAPGEQHIFGVVMVSEFFKRSGWNVISQKEAHNEWLIDAVSSEPFDVVGFSASTADKLDALRDAIQIVRTASINPDISIFVGGYIFNEDTELAQHVGADATAADGVRAVVKAERMVHRLASAEGAT